MAERVWEIRQALERATEILQPYSFPRWPEVRLRIAVALAQAERERSEAVAQFHGMQARCLDAEAEVERLKREVAEGFKVEVMDVTGDPAMMAENGRLKADLARVRAALDGMRFDTSDPPDEMDCPECRENEGLARAALEGRG